MPPSSLGQPGHRCTSRLQCNCAEAVVSAAGEDPAAPAEPSPWGGSRTDRLPFAGGALLERSGPGGLASPLGLGVLQTQAARCAGRGAGSFVSRPPIWALVLRLPGGCPWSQGRWDREEQVLLASAVNQLRGRSGGTGWASCPHFPPLSSSVRFSSVAQYPTLCESLFNQRVQPLLQGGYKAVAWLSPGGGVGSVV